MLAVVCVYAALIQVENDLWGALDIGDLEGVEAALDAGANPDATRDHDELGMASPLAVAAHNGDVEIVRALVGAGADLEAKTGLRRRTPLIISVRAGHPEVVDALLELGAKTNPIDGARNNAMVYAAATNAKIVKRLVEAGANIKDKQGNGNRTPVLTALAHGNTEAALILLEAGCDISLQGGHVAVMSPLMLAASKGYLEVVKAIVAAGADVHALSVAHGKTALEYAREKGHRDVVEFLRPFMNRNDSQGPR